MGADRAWGTSSGTDDPAAAMTKAPLRIGVGPLAWSQCPVVDTSYARSEGLEPPTF
jgi:hypothetical protein